MQSLFTEQAYAEILERLDNLSPKSQAKWGKMDVAQMLAHCKEPLKVPLGKLTLPKPNTIMRFLFSFFKASLYNDKPWKQGLPTSKEYKIVDDRDFEKEKAGLKSLIDEFYAKRNQTEWPPHPFCGHFTTEQWGKMQYKHLDHHFRQFGSLPLTPSFGGGDWHSQVGKTNFKLLTSNVSTQTPSGKRHPKNDCGH